MEPSPQSPISQDDGGLWMKMDSHHVTSHTESPSLTSGERPQDDTNVIPAAPAAITRYYTVMEDEGTDDVFIPPPFPPPPPPSDMAPLLPTEGSTGATASNSGVTLSDGVADATEAKANPSSLDWQHSETPLMAAQSEADEEITGTVQTSEESMDNILLSNDTNSTPAACQDQLPMDGTGWLVETCHDAAGSHHQDNETGNEESNEEPEDIVILSEGQENSGESDAERDKYPKQTPSNHEENLDKEEDETKYVCGLDETDAKLSRENLDGESVETNSPTTSDEDTESSEPAKLSKCTQNKMEAPTDQPDFPADVTNDDEEHVDSRSLDFNLTKYDWVRRESGTTEVLQLPVSKGSEEMVTRGEEEDGSKRIATDIQQGEQLLQRLQLVQLRHDVHTPESRHTPQEVVKGMGGEEKGAGNEEENRFHTDKEEETKTSLMEKENNEKNESNEVQTKARTSSSTVTGQPEHQQIARIEDGDSDDDQGDSWVPGELSPINPLETSSTEVPFMSSVHRFSAAETSIEKQIQEAAQRKQNLQRAGGVFNLADDPDVLEIPFKTNISLESLPTKVGPNQRSDWQFSEQKMQKEISQEIQRELVLVNQGKIPGGYSKGEVRQLKETKLLFEAFQQDKTGGPTRLRKPPTSVAKGHVYPSVLERTRSLEMFSLKTCPVSRAHSLRLYNSVTSEREKSPENFRSKSPTGAARDKTRLSPYSKQDKHLRLYRSMDSISTDVSTLAVETRSKSREGNARQESPLLKQNPFFKLRPALALQPEVAKDIREAREREEELRRQRCTLYGENRRGSEDDDKSRCAQMLKPDVRRGKLERVWPPPSKKDQMKSDQQEPKVHRAGGQKAPLWQRWESGLINGQPSKEKK